MKFGLCQRRCTVFAMCAVGVLSIQAMAQSNGGDPPIFLPGACCAADGSCADDVGLSECLASGGHPSPHATCEEVDCSQSNGLVGACCSIDGGCTDNVAILDCDTGGAFTPNGTCGDVDCTDGGIPRGACCNDDGSCEDDVPGALCAANGGFPVAYSTCAELDCDDPTGGNGLPAGACCSSDGSCEDNVNFLICLEGGGFPTPFASCEETSCDINVPVTGACCDIDGGCTDNVSGFDCDGGAFVAGGTCENIDCTNGGLPVGACCSLDGGCADDVDFLTCILDGGFPTPDAACEEILCDFSEPVVACCLDEETCVGGLLVSECLEQGGHPNPVANATCEETDCSGNGGGGLPAGACCSFDDECTDDVGLIECIESGGFPAPETSCEEISCDIGEPPVGACCDTEGGCQDNVTVADCNGGLFVSDSSCEDIDCSNGGLPVGACCSVDGACTDDVGLLDCLFDGGLPMPFASCDDNVCELLSAPQIVHGSGAIGETHPCSGFIDPRTDTMMEGDDPVAVGLLSADVRFNMPVYGDQFLAEVSPANFALASELEQSNVNIVSVTMLDNDPSYYRVEWDQPLSAGQWSTLTANVYNAIGQSIDTLGNVGSSGNEPDRIDIGFLPGDIDQNGEVNPLDLFRFRQLINGTETVECGELADYLDFNYDGAVSPSDLWVFRQMLQDQSQTGESISDQP